MGRSTPSVEEVIKLGKAPKADAIIVGTVKEYGEPDAFGHRKKANVGEDFGDEVKKRTRQETVISDLTYDLRSGEADFIDKMIASTLIAGPA